MRRILIAILAVLIFAFTLLGLHQSYGDAALVGIFSYLILAYIEPSIPA